MRRRALQGQGDDLVGGLTAVRNDDIELRFAVGAFHEAALPGNLDIVVLSRVRPR